MESDTVGELARGFKQGNNFAIVVTVDSKEDVDRIYNALSKNGEIVKQVDFAFWGDYFRQVTDQFGVNWMLMFTPKS